MIAEASVIAPRAAKSRTLLHRKLRKQRYGPGAAPYMHLLIQSLGDPSSGRTRLEIHSNPSASRLRFSERQFRCGEILNGDPE
jgi:hypothetical protein